MTDIERERLNAICEVAGIEDIEDLSDGFHTFRQLYYQRMILFASIVSQNKDKAWKSLRHENGELCFGGGWFIVGIDTPEGSYTYHYENKYFDLFDCKILDYGKHWDGHTEKDVIRLLSLPSAKHETHGVCLDVISRQKALEAIMSIWGYADEMYKALNEVPSAQPERKVGHWIDREHCQVDEDGYDMGIYSVCGEEITIHPLHDNFCPNCGTDMRGEQDE